MYINVVKNHISERQLDLFCGPCNFGVNERNCVVCHQHSRYMERHEIC